MTNTENEVKRITKKIEETFGEHERVALDVLVRFILEEANKTITINLPRLAGSRHAATELVKQSGDLEGQHVTINMRDARTFSTEFFVQLINEISQQHPASIDIVGGKLALTA